MAGQRGFFSWWFGELREVFSGRPVPVHALAMSETEIALIEKGVDTPMGVVDINADDWREQIEGLRSRIVRRRGKNPLIEVQLPSEQVLFAKVAITDGADREGTVRGHLQELTGQNPDELAFDIAPKNDADGKALVAIAPKTTVSEAKRYATDWGFDAVRVTSLETPTAFRRGPDFDRDGPRKAGSPLPKIAAGLAILALCLAGAAAIRALSIRADLAEQAQREVAALVPPTENLEEQELKLAEFAHAAAMATDERDTTMPVWRILAEVASIIPNDVVLTGFGYETGQLRLKGSATSIESLSEAMDRSPIFNAPYFPETGGRSGRARFVMEVTVDERSIR